VVPSTFTYYRRPGLLGRLFGQRSVLVESAAYVPTSYQYIPSSYVLPTTYSLDMPVLPSGLCCESAGVVSAPAAATSVPAPAQKPAGSAAAEEPKFQPNVLKSQPKKTAESAQPAAPTRPTPAAAVPAPPEPAPPGPATATPPTGDLPAPSIAPLDTDKPLVPPPGDGTGTASPPAPGLLDNPQAGAAGTRGAEATRLAMRPASYRNARSSLVGKVVSAVSAQPEKGVRVTLVPNSNIYRPKSAVTNDKGEFQVILTEGDWTVQVPKPGDAKATIDRPITVAGGLITDQNDDVVSSLTINR
jgi:hypothetical protein